MKGSRFYKADLHMHTPSSKCYQDTGVTADDIVGKAVQEGLNLIAITDHNDISFIEEIRKAAKNKDIAVFPGIEITAINAHILGIFDPSFSIQKLGDLLVTVGIPTEKRGMKNAIGKDIEFVIKEIASLGGVAIASHANSSNGLFKHPQGTYKIKICKMPELMALEFTDREDVEKFCSGVIPQYPPKPCVMCSDAHSVGEIGRRFTFLKMDTISIESLKLALLDYEVKVRFPWDDIEIKFPMIKSLYVSQGFFEGQRFDFHPNLNCLIGGKGTGKSTVIEFMRYCFDDISKIRDIKEDNIGKINHLVGEGGFIQVEYYEENEDYVVQREVIDPIESTQSEVFNKDDEITHILEKPIFFSQGEIARIATSPIAQLELLDRYIDLYAENKSEKDIIGKLKENRAILTTEIAAFDDLMAEIMDKQNGKLATKAEHDRLEKELENPIFREFPKWELEGRFIDDRINGLKSIESTVIELLEGIDIPSYFTVAIDNTSPNYEQLILANGIILKLQEQLKTIKTYFIKQIDNYKVIIQEVKDKWQPFFDKKKKEYDEFLGNLGEANLIQAQIRYRKLKKRLEQLESKSKEALQHKRAKERLEKEREELLRTLSDVRTNRFQKRIRKAREWEDKFLGEIKIKIDKFGDRGAYLTRLKSLLYGSRIYETDIRAIVQTIDPEKLVEACLSNQIEWLVTQSMVREDIMIKIVEYLKTRKFEDVLDLQIVDIQDAIQISFKVEPDKYKALNELSVGTKSTVIVSLAMVEGRNPLVIDQPEDSLDTEFIYNHIVKKLRKEKTSRQFIFTTHNPNILVAGDADMSHVLSASSERGYIKSSGGIDRLDTNRLVLLHLEGGHEAFHLRAQKYLK